MGVREKGLTVPLQVCQHTSNGVLGMTKGILSKRVKATFYFDPDSLAALEEERLRRIGKGVARSEADLSDLMNEAIRRAFPRSGTAAAQGRALRRRR